MNGENNVEKLINEIHKTIAITLSLIFSTIKKQFLLPWNNTTRKMTEINLIIIIKKYWKNAWQKRKKSMDEKNKSEHNHNVIDVCYDNKQIPYTKNITTKPIETSL